MALVKKKYEISIWKEELDLNGNKKETKTYIIGSHDMDYKGKAIAPQLIRKKNGTNSLTFQLYSNFFSEIDNDYIHNEYCDYIFNESKIKLNYNDKWFEFYVKEITEQKNHHGIIYTYKCEDAFIDELSRNGYGLTFDAELYNNVEEIGVFANEVLKDSMWTYSPQNNWGDYTEYTKEKLYKIPVSQFHEIKAHKINFILESSHKIINLNSKEERPMEISDDLAREEKYFWDNGNFDNGEPLNKILEEVKTDGFIYVPYNNLSLCYVKSSSSAANATEEPAMWNENYYCLTPNTNNPKALIQFIAIPKEKEVLIDEEELILNKNFSYVMTVEDWNKFVKTDLCYDIDNKKIVKNEGNKIVYYTDYLNKINNMPASYGKNFSISDRTEINISEDIDRYVKVYNKSDQDYKDLINMEDWINTNEKFRICSYETSRVITPQLARNLLQNGTNISETTGWEVMKISNEIGDISSSIEVKIEENTNSTKGLLFNSNYKTKEEDEDYYTFLNFGIIGQEKEIKKEQTYVLYVDGSYVDSDLKNIKVVIGEGGYTSNGDYFIDKDKRIEIEIELNKYYFIKTQLTISNPYFGIITKKETIFNLTSAQFFEGYTKGKDYFSKGFFKYSGRDILFDINTWTAGANFYYRETNINEFLDETDITLGETYTYTKYFRQQIQYDGAAQDTFGLKSYLNNEYEKNGLDPEKYTDDDYKILTDYLDLNKCKFYKDQAEKDCSYGGTDKICIYQKYGYCPYRFETQKHCRKIRTLQGEKSNRFNLIQEISNVFEVFPAFFIEHYPNGKIKADNEKKLKTLYFQTEKGKENKLGFRYGKNLKNIQRTLDSKQIITKLYVEDVDSELSENGLCSIKVAADNPSKDNYIIDFSYYILKGLLDKDKVNADLYGINSNDMSYLKKMGYYNTQYDILSNKIINLQKESLIELSANIEVNLTGIEVAQQELNRIKNLMLKFMPKENEEKSEVYSSYEIKFNEQKNILLGLIEKTFFTNGFYNSFLTGEPITTSGTAEDFLKELEGTTFSEYKKEFLDNYKYTNYGLMGLYSEQYKQIQKWTKEKVKYLNAINKLSLTFFKKYEPFLKEGTWVDSNYLNGNAYYHGALAAEKESSKPKVNYNITITDLSILDDDYSMDLCDTSFIEDEDLLGINKINGLPNKIKVMIAEITDHLDIQNQTSIKVQNYKSDFEELFEKINATVQSITMNENTYKRSNNFTATKNIATNSLQNSLLDNQLILLETKEDNLKIDYNGQSGSDINNHNCKYKFNGQGLFFSNNGGQTWDTGVSPKGINATYINAGTLDTNKIQIIDGKYVYFLWDNSGITAYRSPQATDENKEQFGDFVKFNKYGLSLVEDKKIRLRAGYSYNAEAAAQGDFSKEQDITKENSIGFFLYDDKGQPIFKTETTDSRYAARLSLGGEMFVADKLQSKIYNPNKYQKPKVKTTQRSCYPLVSILEDNIVYLYKTEDDETLYEAIEKIVLADNPQEELLNYSGINFYKTDEDYIEISNLKEFSEYYYLGDYYYLGITYQFIFKQTYLGENSYLEYLDKQYVYNTNNNKLYETGQSIRPIALSQTLEEKDFELLTDKDLNTVNELSYFINVHLYNEKFKTLPVSTIRETLYVGAAGPSIIYYTEKIEGSEETLTTETENIGIFINNKKNKGTDKVNTERLFSCVKLENNQYMNLFSILDDGSLYIGGKVKELGNKEEDNTLSNFSDEISIEEDNNTITLNKDGITIGNLNIKEYVEGRIDEVIQTVSNLGLITHYHDIGGKKVENEVKGYSGRTVYQHSEKIEDGKISETKVKSFLREEGLIKTVLEKGYIGVMSSRYENAGTSSATLYNEITWIPIQDFLNELNLQIAPNETTENAGSAAQTNISNITYYVEEDI